MTFDANANSRAAAARPNTLPIGHVTICVLCYGDHADLAERFLSSLYHRTDPAYFTLRAGLNAVEPATTELFADYARRFGNIETFPSRENVFKSPMMRRIFHERPLETDWVIWFDDDSYVTRADWLPHLSLKIQAEPTIAQWGQGYVLWRDDCTVEAFITEASWHRGLPLTRGQDASGNPACEFHFCTGGFWAIKSEVIQALDWPDPRLVQAHDDFLLGEALRQNGYHHGNFDSGVRVNDHPRRNARAKEIVRLPQRPAGK